MDVNQTQQQDPLDKDHRARSNFVRRLVHRSNTSIEAPAAYLTRPPKRVMQFWHDLSRLPEDVRECIDSWKETEELGFELLIFDERLARDFIRKTLGARFERAFDKCYHPAMQSDYFRLCYILTEGGCYIDVDDVYRGVEITHLFQDGRLKIQPLCYDISTDEMVSRSAYTKPGANASGWVFYFNNNPLIATRNHPIIKRALASATASLERDFQSQLPEIQATTGPGNLTKSIFDAVSEDRSLEEVLLVAHEWEDIATTQWPLSYRADERNWRRSNQRTYRERKQKEET